MVAALLTALHSAVQEAAVVRVLLMVHIGLTAAFHRTYGRARRLERVITKSYR